MHLFGYHNAPLIMALGGRWGNSSWLISSFDLFFLALSSSQLFQLFPSLFYDNYSIENTEWIDWIMCRRLLKLWSSSSIISPLAICSERKITAIIQELLAAVWKSIMRGSWILVDRPMPFHYQVNILIMTITIEIPPSLIVHPSWYIDHNSIYWITNSICQVLFRWKLKWLGFSMLR